MADSVALNEVVRVLGTELGKNDERILIGSTEEEKEVLQRHATSGKRRAAAGFITGSAVCAGVWKALGGQRRLLGGLTIASGGMAGFMYGILSIRRGLFEDILTLPSDKSPFAMRAREILDEQLPNNPFYLEVKEIFNKQQRDNGAWDTAPSFPPIKPSAKDGRDSGFGFGSPAGSSKKPRLPPLPKDDEVFNNSEESANQPETPSSSPSPFFFGGPSNSDSASSSPPSSSYDYYAAPKKAKDDDPYYTDDGWGDSEDSKPKKPVTWEELRRRAAAGKQ